MTCACLYVPDFPVAAVARSEPELCSRPAAVLEGAPPLLTVTAANGKARTAGVAAGMNELEARARCPQLVSRKRSLEQEKTASAALFDCACGFSPRVEATAPEAVVLDISGLERLFGPPAMLARRLACRARELGLEARVAVAANPDAALHAARGFSGVTVIPPGQEAERLGGLPLEVLAPPPEILETLDRWGIRTLRALAALPEVSVVERLGQAGLHLQKLARGAASRPLVPAEPVLRFEETFELESPLALLEPLAFVLSRLLEQLCGRLAWRALATHELRLRCELEEIAELPNCGIAELKADPGGAKPDSAIPQFRSSAISSNGRHFYERTLRLPVPMLDPGLFLKLWRLELAAHPPPAPVIKVTLAAEPVKPRVAQSGLFQPLAPQPEKLELVLARLAARAGEDSVGSPEIEDTHRPQAFRMGRFQPREPIAELPDYGIAGLKDGHGTAQPNSSIRKFRNSTISHRPLLALRLFRPPRAATVEIRRGRPARIYSSGARGDVLWLAGPWRSSGDWWSEPAWTRDEWDVAVRNGGSGVALYRLVREGQGDKWFVEGEYD
ncbi:MAG TPA: DNA polymerase Y family protein [Terriglobales bacterium]|nr:DNA polymerase Y family protein [Terriglobales bacterium]